VRRILENPAVIGTYSPQITDYQDRKKLRKADGKPVPGYFPAIVDEDTFQRVQALRLNTRSPSRGRNASKEIKNLFGGLAKCGLCGASMVRMSKGPKHTYLVCQNARYGVGCNARMVPYGQLESAFLQHVPRLLASAPTDPKNRALDDQLRQVEANLEALGYQLSSLAEAYAETRMGQLLKTMREIEAEKAARQKALDAIPPDLAVQRASKDNEVPPEDTLESILESRKRR
jgi:hypothetical protein